MNTNLSVTLAAERHQRLVQDAADYRRGTISRSSTKTHRRSHRVSAFLKDVATASL